MYVDKNGNKNNYMHVGVGSTKFLIFLFITIELYAGFFEI